MLDWIEKNIFSNNKKTIFLIGGFVFLLLLIYQIYLLINNTFYNSNSDDFVQYSVILNQYIEHFKSGDFSWFNYENNMGASIFADVYYVPIDIFSLGTLLISFITSPIIAFSWMELLKVLLGVVAFGVFLQKCKFNNKIVLVLSFMYFCYGGCWAFSTFSTYFSLFFYLPFSLLLVKYYIEGKKWIMPLYAFLLILYNFYNAYTLFIFMVLVYIVINIKDNYVNFKGLVKDVFNFGIHIVLGVAMGLFILIPSILYIINYSNRDVVAFQWLFDYKVYMKMIFKLFFYESGTTNLSFSLFEVNGYTQNHYSYYIGFFGLYFIILLFFMKDRVSKIYKYTLVSIIVMMFIPVFSMIFSGVTVAYTRWFSFINIILLIFLGHVWSNINYENFNKKDKIFAISFMGSLFVFALLYMIIFLVKNDGYIEDIVIMHYILMFIFSLVVVSLYSVFCLSKQKGLVYATVAIEMIIVFIINLSVSMTSFGKLDFVKGVSNVDSKIDNLDIGEDSLQRIYFDNDSYYNENRLFKSLVNEKTFHSFLPKYYYDLRKLYKTDKLDDLLFYDLNRYSPLFSRVMDYKYVVLSKEKNNPEFDFLVKVYEDDEYIILENSNYEEFYVYESYYEEKDILDNVDKNSFVSMSKNLFKGVILDEGNYNLDKLIYDYEDLNEINFVSKFDGIKDGNIYKKSLNLNFDYTGSVYFRSDSLSKIDKIVLVSGEEENICEYSNEVFECLFENRIDELLVYSDQEIDDLEYIIFVNDEEKGINYGYFAAQNLFKTMYFSYAGGEERYDILLSNNEGEIRSCLLGFCYLKDFDVDHILLEFSLADFIQGKYNLIKYYEGLDYYYDNKDDVYAENKVLSIDDSKINIKYDRTSFSRRDQVIVLPVSYSEEWVCEDENYELIRVNGAYLGVVVKNDVKNINVSITFKPSGVKIGLVGSFIGFGIYGMYIFFICYRKKKVRIDEIV